MNTLHFGGSGIASQVYAREKLDTVAGITFAKKIGLSALELAFVHNVYLSPLTAEKVNIAAKHEKVELTVHAPYYINLHPRSPKAGTFSKNLLLHAAKVGGLAGARNIAFHPASYLSQDPKIVFPIVRDNLIEVADRLASEHIDVVLRPELRGKLAAFGNLEEIVALSKLRDTIKPCIDFAHHVACTNGKANSFEEFCKVFTYLKNELGSSALHDVHIHFAGILYTAKGETAHANFADCPFDYNALARAFAKFDIKGVAICESPDKEHDALLMKKAYESYL